MSAGGGQTVRRHWACQGAAGSVGLGAGSGGGGGKVTNETSGRSPVTASNANDSNTTSSPSSNATSQKKSVLFDGTALTKLNPRKINRGLWGEKHTGDKI